MPDQENKVPNSKVTQLGSGKEKKKQYVNFKNPKIDVRLILHLSSTKFGMKTLDVIKTLPTYQIVMLKTILVAFGDNNQSKNIKIADLQKTYKKTLSKLGMPNTSQSEF